LHQNSTLLIKHLDLCIKPLNLCIQLDGETDWKKREAIALTQKLKDRELLNLEDASCYAEAPSKVNI
jgi:hypothetical protein